MNKSLKRVKELMKEEGLDIKDQKLVLTIAIIYTKAVSDYLEEQLNENS